MGLRCKIHYSFDSNIDFVEAPNGLPSKLFSEAKKSLDGDGVKGSKVWAVAYTESFKNTFGNWEQGKTVLPLDSNGEPLLRDVVIYIDSVHGDTLGKLSKEDIINLHNNLLGLPENSLDELYVKLRETYMGNGFFKVSKLSLKESGLYTENEIALILSNKNIQKQIYDLILKIEKHLISGDTTDINEVVSTYDYPEYLLLKESENLIGIGKFKNYNPFYLNNELLYMLSGITTESEMIDKLKNSRFENIAAILERDAKLMAEFFAFYSSQTPVEVINKLGKPFLRKDTFADLYLTLLFGKDNDIIEDYKLYLESIPIEVWDTSGKDIKGLLKEIEREVAKFNIDIIGLSDYYNRKSKAEIISFIDEILDFTDDVNALHVSPVRLSKFVNILSDFFGDSNSIESEFINLSAYRTLVKVVGEAEEENLYREHSLLMYKDDVYQKINKLSDFSILTETLFEAISENYKIINEKAFYPNGFTENNTLDKGKIERILEDTNLQENVLSYINKEASKLGFKDKSLAKEVIIYKILFSIPLNKGITNRDTIVKNELTKIKNFKGDYNYLTVDFVSNFKEFILKEKLKNSLLYNNALKYFKIDERGLILEVNDTMTINLLKELLPNDILFDLINYAVISKYSNLDKIIPIDTITEEVMEYEWLVYANNPGLLENFTGDVIYTKNGLAIKNNFDKFVKLNNKLYIAISNIEGVNYFKELSIFNDDFYNMYDKTNLRITKNIDTKVNNSDNFIKENNVLTNVDKLKEINSKIDNCGG